MSMNASADCRHMLDIVCRGALRLITGCLSLTDHHCELHKAFLGKLLLLTSLLNFKYGNQRLCSLGILSFFSLKVQRNLERQIFVVFSSHWTKHKVIWNFRILYHWAMLNLRGNPLNDYLIFWAVIYSFAAAPDQNISEDSQQNSVTLFFLNCWRRWRLGLKCKLNNQNKIIIQVSEGNLHPF